MKKLTTKIIAAIMFLSIIGFSVSAFAAGDNTTSREVVITSLQNKNPLIVKKKINIEAHVQTDDPSNPAKTIKDEDKALVYAFFIKGKDQRQVQLAVSKNGIYKGSIILPSTGEWKVNVMAVVPDPALGQNGTDTMKTTWNVKEQTTPVWIWLVSIIGGILIILIIIWSVRRSRKRRAELEAEKKAKLQQKKNKKNKKKR